MRRARWVSILESGSVFGEAQHQAGLRQDKVDGDGTGPPTTNMDHSSVHFGQLSIQGFRRLSDVRLALRPLSVMIGANGTGKTSVLDVLSLLASSAQGRLSSSLSELSGLANILTYDKAEELGLGITMEVPGHEPLEYHL